MHKLIAVQPAAPAGGPKKPASANPARGAAGAQAAPGAAGPGGKRDYDKPWALPKKEKKKAETYVFDRVISLLTIACCVQVP